MSRLWPFGAGLLLAGIFVGGYLLIVLLTTHLFGCAP